MPLYKDFEPGPTLARPCLTATGMRILTMTIKTKLQVSRFDYDDRCFMIMDHRFQFPLNCLEKQS